MTVLACPHCSHALSPSPPGVFHCGHCGKPHTVATPEQLATLAAKHQEERKLLMIVGAVFFVIYVAPVLLTIIYVAAIFVIYLAFFVVFAIVAATG